MCCFLKWGRNNISKIGTLFFPTFFPHSYNSPRIYRIFLAFRLSEEKSGCCQPFTSFLTFPPGFVSVPGPPPWEVATPPGSCQGSLSDRSFQVTTSSGGGGAGRKMLANIHRRAFQEFYWPSPQKILGHLSCLQDPGPDNLVDVRHIGGSFTVPHKDCVFAPFFALQQYPSLPNATPFKQAFFKVAPSPGEGGEVRLPPVPLGSGRRSDFFRSFLD